MRSDKLRFRLLKVEDNNKLNTTCFSSNHFQSLYNILTVLRCDTSEPCDSLVQSVTLEPAEGRAVDESAGPGKN